MRQLMASQEKFNHDLNEVKSFLLKNSQRTDAEFRKVWQAIDNLTPPPEPERKIGFRLE